MPLPVAVVVVTWNSAHEVEDCLRSALAEDPAEVVVVDNGSADATAEKVRAEFPAVGIVALAENRGFAAGCNLGLSETKAPYVLFLNADARLAPGYLHVLLAELTSNPRAASATGKLVWEREGARFIDSAGIELCAWALRPGDRGRGEPDRGQYDRPGEIFGPSATAAVYRRAALSELGPEVFDEDLFAYYEDVDLAWRLRRLGWRHLYVPGAVALHARRGADDKPREIAARAFANRYLVWLKNESLVRFALYAPVALPWEAARLLRRALRQPALLTGIPAALRLVPRMLAKR
jgi:GT2 family glycosyltransferase